MTIGSPSGSGATQNDIANGSVEAQSRLNAFYCGRINSSTETDIITQGSGAIPNFEQYRGFMASGNSGDWGSITASGTFLGPEGYSEKTTGALWINVGYSGRSVAFLNDKHFIGMVKESSQPSNTDTNIAMFDPEEGSQTGNVIVDNEGTTSEGEITYPTLEGEKHYFGVLIDIGGVYLNSGHTGFYIDKDPRRGDQPDVDISAVPSFVADRGYGVSYSSNGGGTDLAVNYMEVVEVRE